MIKKIFILSIEASDESVIDAYIKNFNIICESFENKLPIKLSIAEKGI